MTNTLSDTRVEKVKKLYEEHFRREITTDYARAYLLNLISYTKAILQASKNYEE